MFMAWLILLDFANSCFLFVCGKCDGVWIVIRDFAFF